jgi:hypothetical protein
MQKERKRAVKKIGRTFAMLLFSLPLLLWGQEASISARSSRTTVGLNEPFKITFSTTSREGNIQPPNFENFILVSGPFQSQQTQIINGNVSFLKELTYQLVAEKEGTFTIAPATIKVKGQLVRSNELTITVKAGVVRENPLSQKAKESFQIEILTSKKSVYVGEPIIMLFRATLFEPVRDLNIIQAPNFENVLQESIDFQQENKREIIDGKMATVLDFDKRLLLPNKPGTLGGQELKIAGQVQVPTGQRDFFGMPLTKFVQEVATANIPAVKIKPLPTPAPTNFSGAVGELELKRTLSRTEVNGDESITLTLRVEGTGNFNTIAVPELIPPQGFDVYDPKYNEKIRYSTSGISGYKEYEYLLVPQFKGQFILPEMRWSYFNTSTETYEEIVLEERSLEVLTGAAMTATTEGAAPTQKRAVESIDDDIRYLQDSDFTTFRDLNLKNWSAAVLIFVGLAWALQGFASKVKKSDPDGEKRLLKKSVELAFQKNAPDKFGVALNALEMAIFMRGIDRENQTSTHLIETFGVERGQALHAFIEKCHLAQYAPGALGASEKVLEEFNALWEWI